MKTILILMALGLGGCKDKEPKFAQVHRIEKSPLVYIYYADGSSRIHLHEYDNKGGLVKCVRYDQDNPKEGIQ